MAVTIRQRITNTVARAKARLKREDLLVSISRIPRAGQDQHGTVYGSPMTVEALVEDVGEMIIDDDGNEALASSKLTIFDPIAIHVADKFVLNGEELNVAKKKALLDPDETPYMTEVWLGRGKLGT